MPREFIELSQRM